MSDFAKLFRDDDKGQVLVMIQGNDETGAPELRAFAEPQGLGVCSLAIGYEDNEKGWDDAEAAFEKTDHENAVALVDPLFRIANGESF